MDFSSKLVIILAAALLIFNGVLYWSGTYPFSNVSSMSSIPAFKANDNRIVLASKSTLFSLTGPEMDRPGTSHECSEYRVSVKKDHSKG